MFGQLLVHRTLLLLLTFNVRAAHVISAPHRGILAYAVRTRTLVSMDSSSLVRLDAPRVESQLADPEWMPKVVADAAARDPFRVALRVLPLIVLHGTWSSAVVMTRCMCARSWSISPLVHTLTGGVLGLLLAFRTNQAWQRWWSACSSWSSLHNTCHNLARHATALSVVDADTYASFMRHLIAVPICLKHRLRRTMGSLDLWPLLSRREADAAVGAATPHLVVLATLSLLASQLRAGDDGSGKSLALWSQLEGGISALQAAACNLDLVSRLPPPASYCVHTARFVSLWLATLPIVLVDLMPPLAVPLACIAVAWALYTTEELAKLLDAPFGKAGDTAETVPVEMYCDQIVSELQQHVGISKMLNRRVAEGGWTVSVSDLEPRPFGTTAPPANAAARGPATGVAAADVVAVEALEDEIGDDDDDFIEFDGIGLA